MTSSTRQTGYQQSPTAEPLFARRTCLSEAEKLSSFSLGDVAAQLGPWGNLLRSSSPILPSAEPIVDEGSDRVAISSDEEDE
jgi:hypothetical protein